MRLFYRLLSKRSERPHILVAVGAYPPGHGGGGLRAHRSYKQVMKTLPIDVTALTISGRGEPNGATTYEGVSVIRTSGRGGFKTQLLELGRFLMQPYAPRVDVVHAMGLSSIASAATTWGLFLGIPIIRELTSGSPLPRRQGIGERVVLKGFTEADLLIALNKNIEKRYAEVGISDSKIWSRPNPVDLEIFRPPSAGERAVARQAFGLGTETRIHLLLGRFQPRKNQVFAVEAAAEMPPGHKLVLAGPVFETDQAYLESVRAAVAKHNLTDRVLIVPEEVKPAILAYHASDVCWIPSIDEGLPNVMLEGLCCGLPIVANEELGLDEHIVDGENGYNVPLDPESFGRAATQILQTCDESGIAMLTSSARERYDANRINAAFAERLTAILMDHKFVIG